MSRTKRVVVIGGDAAGMSAASQLRRMTAASEVEIVAFERGPRTSYAACGLPYLVEDLVGSPDDLIARTPEQFAERGIDARVHHEVLSIDVDDRTVLVRNLAEGTESVEGWDELVIATGGSGVRPPLPGIDCAEVLQLRTLDDAAEMDRLINAGATSAVVVGAGYIGLEVTEALCARGLAVTTIELADSVMAATLDADIAEPVAQAMRSKGVDLRLGTGVETFITADGHLTAVSAGGAEIPCDFAVLGLGVRPNTSVAAEAGVPVGDTGGIVVDERMHTPIDGIWAAGDCVESSHRITGDRLVVALGTHANKQGRVLGINLAGGDATFPGVLGTAITKFAELEIGRTGLSEREADAAGIPVITSTSSSRTRAGYYPGADEVTTKLTVRRDDGTLLGAQIVGGSGAGKRIDTLATAIWCSMTVDDLSMADLSYAPPFSPVRDPVVLAAGVAARELRGATGG